MKKVFRIVTALILVLSIAVLSPLQAAAAAVAKQYISELKLGYGKTAEEAKSWLEGQGYKVVDANLNEDADKMFVSARAVYLGYKTTRKASEAITDLKVMNMKGNYSFEAYDMVLDDMESEISEFVSQLKTSLSEYRENYKAGKYKAVAAHDLLDKIYDDDTDNTMGELLLNKTVQELGEDVYAALPDEEKKQHADMVKILMQGNSSIVLNIEHYMCMASDSAEDTFVDRLAAYGGYDGFETAFAKENGLNSGDAIESRMAAKYGDTVMILSNGVETFRELLAVYTESEMFGETDEDKVIKWFDDNAGGLDYMLWSNARNLYLALSAVEYEDGTLYGFFTDEENDLAGEDMYLLYPMAAALSEGQRACAGYVSLAQLFDNGILDNDSWKVTFDKLKKDVIDPGKTVSVYAGINREVFNGGVALTNAAKQLNDSSVDSFMDNWLTEAFSQKTYVFLSCFAVSTIATVGCKMLESFMKNRRESIYYSTVVQHESNLTGLDESISHIDDLNESFSSIDSAANESTTSWGSVEEIVDSYNSTSSTIRAGTTFRALGNVCCIISLVFAILSVSCAWKDLVAYYNTEKAPVPEYMVDETTDVDGKNTYVYYKAVTCNRSEGEFVDKKNEIMKSYGDLNGDIGKEWLALYWTKDAAAGKPITTDFLCQKGKNTADGRTPLTMFGSNNALNLVDEKYSYNDAFNGLYLFYTTGSSPVFTGSAVSTGISAVIAAAGLAVGFIPAFLLCRKKKKNVPEEA